MAKHFSLMPLSLVQQAAQLNGGNPTLTHAASTPQPPPAQDTHPQLYEVVTSCMLHGPCGEAKPSSPCMGEDGTCSKRFPKPFCAATVDGKNSYPEYRRRDNGATFERQGLVYDNRWVVPYNPYLSLRYKCHINVEVCTSISSVKYLYKYVYKGNDRAVLDVLATGAAGAAGGGSPPARAAGAAAAVAPAVARAPRDEVKDYLDGRYCSASEAAWRLFAFPMHEHSPPVTRLAVHLPGAQTVVFDPSRPERVPLGHTTLTQWFSYNRTEADKSPAQRHEAALNALYHDFGAHCVWDKGAKVWKKRERNAAGGTVPVGRMYYVQPSQD